jgi:hypothetical protein
MNMSDSPVENRPSKLKRRLRIVALLTAALALYIVISKLNMAPATEGWVVDADSGEPVEGVVVVAYWGMEKAWAWSVAPAGAIAVFEEVTDKDGYYRIPGWGPRLAKYSVRESADPLIILFKNGYEPKFLSNMTAGGSGYNSSGALYRPSMWDGKTVELKRFGGDLPKQANALGVLGRSLESYVVEYNCGWKKIPRMLLALKEQRELMTANKQLASFVYAGNIRTDEKLCGSPDSFFKEYKP